MLLLYFILICMEILHFHCEEAWAHKTSLTAILFIEVSVQSQESDQSFMCVLVVSICLFIRVFHWIIEMFR